MMLCALSDDHTQIKHFLIIKLSIGNVCIQVMCDPFEFQVRRDRRRQL